MDSTILQWPNILIIPIALIYIASIVIGLLIILHISKRSVLLDVQQTKDLK